MADLPCADCGHKFKQGEERVVDLQDGRQYCEKCRNPDGLTTMRIGQAREHFRLREQDKEVKHYRPSLRHDKEWQQEQAEKKRAQKEKEEEHWQDRFKRFQPFSTAQFQVSRSHGTIPKRGTDDREGKRETEISEANRERVLRRLRPNYDATDDEIKDWYE